MFLERGGSVTMTKETRGWGVGRDWAKAGFLHVAHAEDTCGERLLDPEP